MPLREQIISMHVDANAAVLEVPITLNGQPSKPLRIPFAKILDRAREREELRTIEDIVTSLQDEESRREAMGEPS